MTSRLTSIELDTLRMWERRYGFPKPERSGGGSRLYSDADVEALKLIARALKLGHRPGEVVGRTIEELGQLVGAAVPLASTGEETAVEALLDAVTQDDADALNAEVRRAAIVLGPRRFLTQVVQPTAVRVGELWSEGKLEVRHEHMLTECFCSHLRVLRSAYEDRQGTPRVLLATLPGERHRLGLEMVDVYLAVNQIRTRMLGVDTPAAQVVAAAKAYSVDAIGLLVTEASDLEATSSHVAWMITKLPRQLPVWLGGAGAARTVARGSSVRTVQSWEDLDDAIEHLRRTATGSDGG